MPDEEMVYLPSAAGFGGSSWPLTRDSGATTAKTNEEKCIPR
jgi:hypothetical protein